MAKKSNTLDDIQEEATGLENLLALQRARLAEMDKQKIAITEYTRLVQLQEHAIQRETSRLAELNATHEKTVAVNGEHSRATRKSTKELEMQARIILRLNDVHAQRRKVLDTEKEKLSEINKEYNKTILLIKDITAAEAVDRIEKKKAAHAATTELKRNHEYWKTKKKETRDKEIEPVMENLPMGGKLDWLADKLPLSVAGKKRVAGLNETIANDVQTAMKKPGAGAFSGMAAGGKSMLGGMGEMMSVLPKLLGPLAVILAVIAAIKKLFEMAAANDKLESKVAKSLSISKKAAGDMAIEIRKGGATIEATLPILEHYKSTFGTIEGVNERMAGKAMHFGKVLGMADETSAALFVDAKKTGLEYDDYISSIAKANNKWIEQTGRIRNVKDVLEDIAKVSSNVRALFGKNTDELVKQVNAARSLGMTLDESKQQSTGLLDIQASLAEQYEASAMAGVAINLEEARALAFKQNFTGASASAAREIAKSVDWENAHWMVKEKLARAANVEVDQLAKTIKLQKIMGANDETNKKIISQKIVEYARATDKRKEELKVELKAYGVLVDTNFEAIAAIEDRRTAEEKWEETKALLTEAISANIPGISKFLNWIAGIGEHGISAITDSGKSTEQVRAEQEKFVNSKEGKLEAAASTMELKFRETYVLGQKWLSFLGTGVDLVNKKNEVVESSWFSDEKENIASRHGIKAEDFTINPTDKSTITRGLMDKNLDTAKELQKNNGWLQKIADILVGDRYIQFSDQSTQKVSNTARFSAGKSGQGAVGMGSLV